MSGGLWRPLSRGLAPSPPPEGIPVMGTPLPIDGSAAEPGADYRKSLFRDAHRGGALFAFGALGSALAGAALHDRRLLVLEQHVVQRLDHQGLKAQVSL